MVDLAHAALDTFGNGASMTSSEPAATAEAATSTTIATGAPIFEDLYEEQFLPMVKFAALMTGNVEVARDIVQDSFVKLHVKWVGVEHPKAYLRTSVVNACRSRARWERRRRGTRRAALLRTAQ